MTATPIREGAGRWRIGVSPIFEHRTPGVGHAIAYGLSSPADVLMKMATAIYEIFAKPPDKELRSSVSMVREMQRETRRGPAEALLFAAAYNSYLWLFFVAAAAVIARRAKPRAPHAKK